MNREIYPLNYNYNCSMAHRDFDLLYAKPLDKEPDRAKIKWPKPKRFRIKRKTVVERRHFHPGTKEARRILRLIGRGLSTCEECGRTKGRIVVHHIDGIPYNNNPENLQVLCWRCHKKKHNDFEDSDIIDEFAEIPFEDEDVIVEDVDSEKNYLSISLCMSENEIEKAPKGAIVIINNNTLHRETERYNFSKKAYPEHINMLIRLEPVLYECRHCDFYRAFKHRCDLLNQKTEEHNPACISFKPR